MADNSTDIRKYLNVLQEGGPLAPGVFDDPMSAPAVDPAMDDPMDDAPTTGPETKIEVTMKDGDEVEVEVYAQQGDELKRIMDLAGMFHKDKQSGTLGAEMGAEPALDAGLPMSSDPAMDMGAAMMAPDMEPDMDMEPEMSEIPPMGGPDVPVGADMAPDMAPDMDVAPEVDFSMDDEMGDDVYEETNPKRHDFGYPNPELGQEEYELKAFDFSGGASKPVRHVPARSGDNPMVDMSNKRSLQSYIQEVDDSKKKE